MLGNAQRSPHSTPQDQRTLVSLRSWSVRRSRNLRLASAYENLADRPFKHQGALSARIPVEHTAVMSANSDLHHIAARLRATPPPPENGVRAARRLLTDGAGPLYRAQDNDALRHEAERVLELLSE
jgi:hypothetical protein